ncbi:MAG: hypothetical protein ACI36Y_01915 [Coriobacteriales bacterium]
MVNGKLEQFIDEHRCKRAVEHKVAKRDSGLDLLSARVVDSPGVLRGTLVVKTWAKCSMIWAYVIDAGGALWDFALYKQQKKDGKSLFELVQSIPLGTEVEAAFYASKSGKVYCKGISAVG